MLQNSLLRKFTHSWACQGVKKFKVEHVALAFDFKVESNSVFEFNLVTRQFSLAILASIFRLSSSDRCERVN